MPGMWELIIIVLILVVLFGGSRAMDTIKSLGREVYDIRKRLDDINDIKKGKF
ncbi:MAG: twin-arginine translocase TatA/TatE family subunit [Spirochaetota bacterium]|nr:twin-arginine translocase TatA/TatE family subunit [Spirochaetota bacterium]HPV99355.1 twin-arginine translocase TatA/TatE family subunit [Spirochaetota bacterium]